LQSTKKAQNAEKLEPAAQKLKKTNDACKCFKPEYTALVNEPTRFDSTRTIPQQVIGITSNRSSFYYCATKEHTPVTRFSSVNNSSILHKYTKV
jgi:hypothetical protein